MRKTTIISLVSAAAFALPTIDMMAHGGSPTLEEIYTSPAEEHKPIIIWQWMDGLVTREGITRDLEAFRDAGLAGVHNFQIGGPEQMRIGNPDNAIGSDNWKDLLRFTLDECERLSLSFGTHNCPGWSSSAYPTVKPQYSMLELVSTETPLRPGEKKLLLPAAEVDPRWNYYEDVAVFAIPGDSVASRDEIIDLTPYFNTKKGELKLPSKLKLPAGYSVLRIGQTTNGKTNEAQAPESGCGLECDKMSREAVLDFWKGYPTMLIETAGPHCGNTFTHIEIDSYEAGGQTWSPALPEEFQRRNGYDLSPYLPYMTGRMKRIGTEEETRKFRKDWENTVKDCVAENYYGYMSELASASGLTMMIEPYGTGRQKPFGIIDFERIVKAAPDADIATEFWQDPPTWGWRDMGKHEASMRKMRKPLLLAEAFTCWPIRPWKDSPATIKPVCDKAFCTGVNRMMLHAGAANPWPDVEPGMSFGKWGTQFVPGQTWWKAGGAKELFGYMARCQALLQQGLPAPEQLPAIPEFLTYHRVAGDTDIIFISNQADTLASGKIPFHPGERSVEVWDPYNLTKYAIAEGGEPIISIEPHGSRFLIIRPGESRLEPEKRLETIATLPLNCKWTLSFPDAGMVTTDSLFSWPDSDKDPIRYFSGTATYRTTFRKPDKKKTGEGRTILSLGVVENMARVKVNGKEIPLLWKAPYECDITDVLNDGVNDLEIEVTNLWPNRMIGDEHEPDDLEWSEPLIYDYAPGKPRAGCYLTSNPEWLQKGESRPSPGRKTVGCFKFFTADSPLLPSGLLGPVSLEIRK